MKRTISKAALAASCSALLFAAPAGAEPEVGAVAQRDFLGATGTRENGERRDLFFNREVYTNELVETGTRSTTNLVFLDRTSLYVGVQSQVRLDKFVYDPEQRLGDVAISFGKGAFRFVTGDIQNKENVSLSTPTATMTIRGTELLIFVLSDGTSEVNVLSGAIDLLPCNADQPVRVETGRALLISSSCETAEADARILPFGDEYPRMPTEFAALDDTFEPAAGGDDPPGGDEGPGDGPGDGPPAPKSSPPDNDVGDGDGDSGGDGDQNPGGGEGGPIDGGPDSVDP